MVRKVRAHRHNKRNVCADTCVMMVEKSAWIVKVRELSLALLASVDYISMLYLMFPCWKHSQARLLADRRWLWKLIVACDSIDCAGLGLAFRLRVVCGASNSPS